MKRLTQISLTAILLLLLNGCNPSSLMTNEQLDMTLPKLNQIHAIPSTTSVAFEWQPLARKGITGYNIYRTVNKNNKKQLNSTVKQLEKVGAIHNSFASHYVDTGLQQNRIYTYTFTTVRKGFESAHGKIITVKTLPAIEPVTFFQGFQKAQTVIKLIWRPHPDKRIKMYKIERSVNKGEFKWISSVKTRMMSEFIDGSVAPGNLYTYRVTAIGFDDSISQSSKLVSIKAR